MKNIRFKIIFILLLTFIISFSSLILAKVPVEEIEKIEREEPQNVTSLVRNREGFPSGRVFFNYDFSTLNEIEPGGEAFIYQLGFRNQATINQFGESNTAIIDQGYGYFEEWDAVESEGNIANIDQDGNNNYAAIGQWGNDNTADIVQSGAGNKGKIFQEGSDNQAYIFQEDVKNTDGYIEQTGNENRALLIFTEKGEKDKIIQNGNNNKASSLILGAGTSMTIEQYGDNQNLDILMGD